MSIISAEKKMNRESYRKHIADKEARYNEIQDIFNRLWDYCHEQQGTYTAKELQSIAKSKFGVDFTSNEIAGNLAAMKSRRGFSPSRYNVAVNYTATPNVQRFALLLPDGSVDTSCVLEREGVLSYSFK